MSALIFVRDGRTLPYIPVTVVALDAMRLICDTPRESGERRSYPHVLAVYMALLELANDDRADRVAISQVDLGERSRTSRAAVQRALADLQAAGVVVKHEQVHGRAKVENEYVVVEPSQQAQETTPSHLTDAGVASDRGNLAGARPSHPSDAQLSEKKKTEEAHTKTAMTSTEVHLVFDAWVTATGRDPARTKLTPERVAQISKAVKTFGVEDCVAAVTNLGRDPFASGVNDRGTPYNDLVHALGSAKRLERYRDWEPPQHLRVVREANGKPTAGQLLRELDAANPRLNGNRQALLNEGARLHG